MLANASTYVLDTRIVSLSFRRKVKARDTDLEGEVPVWDTHAVTSTVVFKRGPQFFDPSPNEK